MTVLEEAIKKIRDDLDWRGPNGKTMGYVMVSRAQAIALLQMIEALGKKW